MLLQPAAAVVYNNIIMCTQACAVRIITKRTVNARPSRDECTIYNIAHGFLRVRSDRGDQNVCVLQNYNTYRYP